MGEEEPDIKPANPLPTAKELREMKENGNPFKVQEKVKLSHKSEDEKTPADNAAEEAAAAAPNPNEVEGNREEK